MLTQVSLELFFNFIKIIKKIEGENFLKWGLVEDFS